MKSMKILSLALAGVLVSFANAEVSCPSGFKAGLQLSATMGKTKVKDNYAIVTNAEAKEAYESALQKRNTAAKELSDGLVEAIGEIETHKDTGGTVFLNSTEETVHLNHNDDIAPKYVGRYVRRAGGTFVEITEANRTQVLATFRYDITAAEGVDIPVYVKDDSAKNAEIKDIKSYDDFTKKYIIVGADEKAVELQKGEKLGDLQEAFDAANTAFDAAKEKCEDPKNCQVRSSHNITKAAFGASILTGYDWQVGGNMMLGIDLDAGWNFAGKTKAYFNDNMKKDAVNGYIQLQRSWELNVGPRFGIMVTPACELFLKGGLNVTRYKLSCRENDGKKVQLADGISNIFKGKTKAAPFVGAGVTYNFAENFGATLSYAYLFNSRIKFEDSTEDAKFVVQKGYKGELKTTAHKITLGAFYRF